LVGQGAMSGLSMTTAVTPLDAELCQQCDEHPDMSAHAETTQAGLELHFSSNEAWLRCAQKTGKLQVRFFSGADGSAVMAAIKPVHVVKNLEQKAKQKLVIPYATVCKPGPTVAWEFYGTGEMRRMNGRGVEDDLCKRRRK
jgi:hypothetical protein